MKTVLICLALFGCVILSQAQPNEEFQKLYKECLDETKVSDEDIKKFATNGFQPSQATENIKCHMKCLMEKRGILKNGVYDGKAAVEAIMQMPQLKDKRAEIEQAVNACKDTPKGKNDCETAYLISLCFKDQKGQMMV